MKRRYPPKPRGAVLLLVIAAVAILTAVVVEVAQRVKVEVLASARVARENDFQRIFASGLEAAEALLNMPREVSNCDYWGEPWSQTLELPLGPGKMVSVRIDDDAGKINLRDAGGDDEKANLARTAIARLFARLQAQNPRQPWEEVRQKLLKRLGNQASEPLCTLDGLRENGLDCALIFGSDDGHEPRLCDYLTVFGEGKINLNTAPAEVIYALDEACDDQKVARFIQWRGERDDNSKPRAIRNLREIDEIDGFATRDQNGVIVDSVRSRIERLAGVTSDCFSVHLVAKSGDQSRHAVAYYRAENEAGQKRFSRIAYEELEP